MKMTKISIALGCAVLLLALGIGSFFFFQQQPPKDIPTYFTYVDTELSVLDTLSSKQILAPEDVYYWDQIAFDLVIKNTPKKDFTEETSKIYAYLALAQREFGYLSFNQSGRFAGSFDALSKDVLCLFFKADCASIIVRGENDPYSEAISALVFAKITDRIEQDAKGYVPYELKQGGTYWLGPEPQVGIANGHSLGFFINSGDQFRALQPPASDSEEFLREVTNTKRTLETATKDQKEAVVFWAGGPGTITPPGQLLVLADSYMEGQQVELKKVLLVRSVVAMGVADAVTAAFDSKYAYQVKRPYMMDTSIVSIMPTPNHPSYPSGHSTLSATVATILTHYFPENGEFWKAQAEEAGLSRVWGGIHYMMDHTAGVTIGVSVANEAIKASETQ